MIGGARGRRGCISAAALASAIVASLAGGCSSESQIGLGDDDDSGISSFGAPTADDASSGGDSGPFVGVSGGGSTPGCAGLSCYVDTSCGSSPTTITGVVYDPAGVNPIYDAVVFVPSDPGELPAVPQGTASCNTCDAPIGDYLAAAQTDVDGKFTLTNVPTGKNVPLVVQIGKWRRSFTVAETTACATTQVPQGAARLPRNRGEGSMPQMALVTGGFDNLGCFMRKIGVDDAEYSAPHAGGALDIYQGNGLLAPAPALSSGTAGDCTTASCPLWSAKQDLENYDIVLLACEGDTFDQAKPASAKQAMHDWLDEGGRVFATHFQYTWFMNSPDADFQHVADWLGTSLGIGIVDATIDTSFPKGQVFQQWLSNVGALTNGTIDLTGVATSVSTVDTTEASRWIYDGTTSPPDTKYFSFETPIGGVAADGGAEQSTPQYCGKAVFSDLHAGGAPQGAVPSACDPPQAMTAQEKALEFLFFDLSACVTLDSKAPPPPPPPAQ